MRALQFSLAFIYALFSSESDAQNFQWLQWSPRPGINSDVENFNAIACDPFGNTYLAVQFTGVLTIGSYSFQSAPIDDICILKYDSTGQFIWAKAMGSLYWDQVNGMDCDAEGNLYLTGHYFGVFRYGGDSLIGNAGGREMFLLKVTPEGQVAWAVNGANPWDEEGTDVRALPGGGVVMSGRANNTAYIGNLQINNPNLVMQEFIAAFTSDGEGQWIRSCGPSGTSSLYYSNATLECGTDGSIYLGYSGSFEFVMNGDTIRPWYYPEFSANYDVIVQKWTSNGDPVWGKIVGSLGQDLYGDIGVDDEGRVYGTLNSPMDSYFGGDTLKVKPGNWASTVMRWNADGTEDTAWHYQSAGFTTLQALVCDADGNAWVGGILRDSLYTDFGTFYTPTENHRHGLLYRVNSQSNAIDRVERLSGEGWKSIFSLRYNAAANSLIMGGNASAGNQYPMILGFGEDIIEGFSNNPANWAYLASYKANACEAHGDLIVSDSLLCPNETAFVTSADSLFFYTWNSGDISSSIVLNSDAIVQMQAIDSSGCLVKLNAVVETATPVQLSVNVSDVSCAGLSDGAIDVNMLSGLAPFTFNWSNGQASEDLQNLSAGSYSLTAISAQGCVKTQSFAVSQPQAINGQLTESNGIITLSSVTGGTPPYSISWSDFPGETGTSVSFTNPGNYSVTISDANGCISEESIIVTRLNKIALNSLLVFPNPTSGSNFVEVSGLAGVAGGRIIIENALGQRLFDRSIEKERENLSLHGITNVGLCFLHIVNQNGQIICTRKLVLN
jgi:hypothetical protein